jgi:hypothetical protein
MSRSFRPLLMVLVALAFLAAGCGGEDSEDDVVSLMLALPCVARCVAEPPSQWWPPQAHQTLR